MRRLARLYKHQVEETSRQRALSELKTFQNDKQSIHQEDITITNVQEPSNKAAKEMKQQSTDLKEGRDKFTIILRFNIPVSATDRSAGQKNQ